MRAPAAAALADAAVAAGTAFGLAIGWAGEPEEVTATVERTVTHEAPGLPPAVERTREALLRAAEQGDYEAVRRLIPDDGFTYSFGGPVDGGAVAYWRQLERTMGDPTLRILAAVLRLPYTLSRGLYVWPFAYDLTADELTAHERRLLAPLGREGVFVGEGYYGWRAGIEPDGDWVFFVAGD